MSRILSKSDESIFDILFDQNLLIYQDILLWHSESYFLNNKDSILKRYKIRIISDNSSNDFRITELGYWLLYYHQPFRDKYAGSHIRKSNHLHDQRDNIKNKVNELIKLGLISETEKKESGRNKNIITTEYRFTSLGIIYSWLIALYKKRDNNDEDYFECQEIFLYYIYQFLENIGISIFEILKNFLKECEKKQLIKKIILLERYIGIFVSLFNKNLSSIRQTILALISVDEKLYQIWIQCIKELTEGTKNIILLQFKLEIESLFEDFYDNPETIKKFELLRTKNIHDPNNVIIIGICNNCKYVPIKINIFSFLQLFKDNFELLFWIDESLPNKNDLDGNKIDKIFQEDNKRGNSLTRELCNICNNQYLKIYFSIVKDTNNDNLLISVPDNMLSFGEWIEKEKSIFKS